MIEKAKVNIRWSDLDPNFHVKHSSYYDLASQYRMDVLRQVGVTMDIMERDKFAPILLREECVFLREMRYTDNVFINFIIKEVNENGSKWEILHEFIDDKNKVKARLTVNIAWFDIAKRKFISPMPAVLTKAYEIFTS